MGVSRCRGISAPGNNLFGEALRTLLTEIRDSSERQAYILMERVSPALFLNYPVTPVRDDDDDDDDDVTLSSMVSELGIFGTLVGSVNRVAWS